MSGSNFGERLISAEILREFKDFCRERDMGLRERVEEYEKSREDIREKSTLASRDIYSYLKSIEENGECPIHGEKLLEESGSKWSYCPVCYERV